MPKRWLSVGSCGMRKHARELVAQRARPVGLDVGRREREALAAPRQERLQRRLGRARPPRRARAVVALGVEQDVVERRGLRGPRAAAASPPARGAALMPGSASATDWPGGPREQRRELERARGSARRAWATSRSVSKRSSPRPRADPLDVAEQLVAQRPERRVQRLVGAEELLLAVLPLGAERRARLLGERRRRLRARRGRMRRRRQHERPRARASSRRAAAGASRRRAPRAVVARQRSLSSASGIGSVARAARPASARTAARSTKTWSNSRPVGRVHRQHAHGAVARPRRPCLGSSSPQRRPRRPPPA